MIRHTDRGPRLREAGKRVAAAFTVRVRAILSLGMVLGLGATGTFALWANSATATSGMISTGTVDLRVNDIETFAFSDLALTGMLPGESKAASIQVQNTRSTMDVTYTMDAQTATGSPALTRFLQIGVHSGGTPTNSTANGMRTGTCSGSLISSAFLTAGSSVPLVSAQRPLAGKVGTETLCFVATLSTGAPITVQNQSLSSILLAFNARTTV